MIGIKERASVLLRFALENTERLVSDLARNPSAYAEYYRARVIGESIIAMSELFLKTWLWETALDEPAFGQVWFNEEEAFTAQICTVNDFEVCYARHSTTKGGGAVFSMPRKEWPGAYRLIPPAVSAFIARAAARAVRDTARRVIAVLRAELENERPIEEAIRSTEIAFSIGEDWFDPDRVL